VELGGTLRTLRPETRRKLQEKLFQVVKSVADAFNAQVEINWIAGYPSVVNSPKETAFARQVAADIVGKDKVLPFSISMGGEDFAYFLQVAAGAYIVLGTGKTDEDPGLHSPHFDFNDDMLPLGAAYWVRLVESWLQAT